MKVKLPGFVALVLVMLTFASGVLADSEHFFAGDEAQKFIKRYQPLVDKALKAYNTENYRAFYENFATARLARTKGSFQAIWVNEYKAKFGNLISKKLENSNAGLNRIYPMFVYKAKFKKIDDATIKVIFIEEGGSYKIFYIRFDDLGRLSEDEA